MTWFHIDKLDFGDGQVIFCMEYKFVYIGVWKK